MQRFPNTVDDLIRELDHEYPERIAQPGDDPREFFEAALQRSVVVKLKERRARALQRPFEAPPQPRGKGRDVSR